MSITLSSSELFDLTHYKRASDQIAALNQMGIDHYIRPDGTPAVLRSTLEGREDRPEKKPKVRAA